MDKKVLYEVHQFHINLEKNTVLISLIFDPIMFSLLYNSLNVIL